MSSFCSIVAGKTLYTLRTSLLLSSSNDVFTDPVDDEDSFKFSPKAEFRTRSCFAQLLQHSQNILKLLTFKCFLNGVLLETVSC